MTKCQEDAEQIKIKDLMKSKNFIKILNFQCKVSFRHIRLW